MATFMAYKVWHFKMCIKMYIKIYIEVYIEMYVKIYIEMYVKIYIEMYIEMYVKIYIEMCIISRISILYITSRLCSRTFFGCLRGVAQVLLVLQSH